MAVLSRPNLPNSLTILRVIALPFCAYALFKNGGTDSTWQIIAWCGFFLTGLTDFLDGKIARARKQVTAFGTFLDPVADKAAIGTAMIGLSIQGRLWWWVTLVILAREIAVTVRIDAARHAEQQDRRPIPAAHARRELRDPIRPQPSFEARRVCRAHMAHCVKTPLAAVTCRVPLVVLTVELPLAVFRST